MAHMVIRRLLETVPVLIIMSMLVFSLTLLLPGDPVLGMLGPGSELDEATVEQMREELNLNDPIPVQYLAWVGDVLQGDLGRSTATNQPVADAIVKRVPVTAMLAVYALTISISIAMPLGILAAIKRGTRWDLLASSLSVFGVAMPSFWLAILMISFFGVRLGWFPASGYVSPMDDPLGTLRHLFLPALAMGIGGAASLTRYLRSSLLEVLSEDYVTTARAKGLRGSYVIARHVLRNALIPFVTVLGIRLGDLFGGSLIIESIFLVPGVGSLMVNAIFTRDFPVIQAGTLVIALIVVVANLGVDVLYGFLDPRIA